MPTRQIFNATTQAVEDAELSVDSNNEIVAKFTNGSFVKFPAGLTSEEFDAQIEALHTANEGQEVITPEYEAALIAERANSLALIGATEELQQLTEPDNTMPVGIQSDAPIIEATELPVE